MAVPSFLETPRFPSDIAYGSSGGPEFNNYVFEGHTGIEQVSVGWTRARAKYNVAFDVRDKAAMDVVRAFFYNVKGRATRFRFKDWSDYQLADELIGTGDGLTTVFNITKTYTTGAQTYVRRIFKPVDGGDTPIVVKVNDVAKTEDTDYTVDYTTGKITFLSAPANGHTVKVTCEFDVPVRFDTDKLDAKHEGWQTESWGSITLVEVLLED